MYSIFFGLLLFFVTTSCNTQSEKQREEKKEQASDSFQATDKIVQLFQTCVPCHGEKAQGKQEMNAPALVNQEAWYLENQFWAFKKGFRGKDARDTFGAQMYAIAQTIDDENNIRQLAQYIKTFEPYITRKTIEGNVKAGESHYNMICGACHGPGAKGNKDMNAPKLTGLDDWYLERQLLHYRNGIRGSHPDDVLGLQMQSMAKTIKDEQTIRDIVAYIQSLQESSL